VTVVLKQAKDGPLAKALDAAALEEINDVFSSTSLLEIPSFFNLMMAL